MVPTGDVRSSCQKEHFVLLCSFTSMFRTIMRLDYNVHPMRWAKGACKGGGLSASFETDVGLAKACEMMQLYILQ